MSRTFSPSTTPSVLIIGGTAAYGLDLTPYRPVGEAFTVATPYGSSPPITLLQPDPARPPVAFCSRHGAERLARSAAFVNQRAVVWAAREIGVKTLFSWNGVGAISPNLEVGDLVVPHDFLDFTRARAVTFGQEDLPPASGPAFHPAARAALLCALAQAGAGSAPVYTSGVYVCTEGPRLETASEIALYARCGADVVGMTLSPEVFLAQEAGLTYASLCYVTNYATGRSAGRPPRRQFGPEVAQTCLPVLVEAGDRETGRPGGRETGKPGNRETGRPGNRETGRPGDRETGRPGDRETGKPGNRETGRPGE